MKYHILETLSFKQQVTLFYHSDIIMSPHGTGLINIMFSLPHSTLIECHPPFFYDVWFINTASLSSVHYIGVSTYMPKSKMSKLYTKMSNLYNTGNLLTYNRNCRNYPVNPPLFSLFSAVKDAIEYTSRWRFVFESTDKWSPIFN